MWIHESFTNYSESLFLEYFYGKEAGYTYVRGIRKNIKNDKPIIGQYNVNNEGSSDMYYKGANMLHTLRQIVDNDAKWRMILRGLSSTFYHQTVSTKQIEDYLSKEIGIDLEPFFNQYLRDTRIPTLEYFLKDETLGYRWTNCVVGFNMPVKVQINGQEQLLKANTEWQKKAVNQKELKLSIDKNFYVASFEITE
jgi:aminopeptidase N